MKTPAAKKKPAKETARAAQLFEALRRRYPGARCALNWSKPHELLIATILSAQSTDVGVNKATPALFARFPEPRDYAGAALQEIEPFVRTLNFWRNKARAVHESMKLLCERFRGEVPRTMEDLLELRGVARKTANVVLGNAFGLNVGVVVDTHVLRLSGRMGLTKETDPAKVEADLMSLFPRDQWCMLSHLLIFHGRAACKARGATCASDPICAEFCSEAAAPKKSTTSRKARKKPRRG